MQIFGDAWTWWQKATGKYDEGHAPKPGAVLVFRSQGKMKLGHVAVVSQVITDRYIQVTHANWSPVDGHRGRVEENVNVLDVSDKGDWSKVKVWYGPLNDLGTTVYSTYGFIYQAAQSGQNMGQQLIAQITDHAVDKPAAPAAATPTIMVAQATLPDDLKAALTPGASEKSSEKTKPVTVSAQITGASATALATQLSLSKAVPVQNPTQSDVQTRSKGMFSHP